MRQNSIESQSPTISIGNGASANAKIVANNDMASKPELRYDRATNKWQYSNDGSSFSNIGSGGASGVSSLTATAPIAGDVTTGDITISIPVATSTDDGYLTSADWSTFNGKVSGTIGNSSGNIVSRPADNTVGADTIAEISSGVGVTVDGVLLKDNDVQADEVRTDIIIEKTATNGVAIEGVIVKDSFLEMTEIAAPDSPAADKLRIYAKDSSGTTKLYTKDSAGTETELGAGGSGSTSDTSWTSSNWTSTTSSPSQRAVQELANNVGVDTLASALESLDNDKILTAYYTSDSAVTSGGVAKWSLINVLTDGFGSYTLTNSGLTFSTDAGFPLGSRYVAIADGSSFASVSSTGFPVAGAARTVTAWIKTSDTSGSIFSYGSGSGAAFEAAVSGGYLSVSNYSSSCSDATLVNTGAWKHVAFVFNGSAVAFYINGSLSSSQNFSTNTASGTTAHVACGLSEAYKFTGSIADVRLYSRAITADEVSTIYGGEPAVQKYTLSDKKTTDIIVDQSICQGRLTLTTGVPVTTSDVTAATTLYFTPYNGNLVGLYSGASWSVSAFSELSLSLSGYTANKNYDIWIYDNAGTLTLDSTIWTDDTTRATALTTQDGI
ncbi:MAG: LamG domain-containing protein, partial [Synergistaceae bacterium]